MQFFRPLIPLLLCLLTSPVSVSGHVIDCFADMFVKADADGDGRITVEEYEALVQAAKSRKLETLKESLQSEDRNGDDILSLEEFISSRASDNMIESSFRQLDKDGDGVITCGDLKDVTSWSSFDGIKGCGDLYENGSGSLNMNAYRSMVVRKKTVIFRNADKDNNNFLDINEYAGSFLAVGGPVYDPFPDQDINDDGNITADEFCKDIREAIVSKCKSIDRLCDNLKQEWSEKCVTLRKELGDEQGDNCEVRKKESLFACERVQKKQRMYAACRWIGQPTSYEVGDN